MPTAAEQKPGLKTKLNVQWLTTPETNKNARQLVFRLLAGIALALVALSAFLRIPYFGEFLDGVVFDLLLFGTAKYFAYAFLFAIGVVFLVYRKNYWRLFATKRFWLFFWLVMASLSLVFAIVNFFQAWPAGTTIAGFFAAYFNSWIANAWVSGVWFWARQVFVNGGLLWTVFFSLNAGVPSLVLFVLLAILLIAAIVAICAKLKAKPVERWRKKCIVWLGGFYERAKTQRQTQTEGGPSAGDAPPRPDGDPPSPEGTGVVFVESSYRRESPPAAPDRTPRPQSTLVYDGVSGTQPFSIKLLSKKSFNFLENIDGKSDRRFDENRAFAKTAMANLADLFAKLKIGAEPIKSHAGPTVVLLEWQLADPSDLQVLTKHKNAIQQALGVPKFDVYLKDSSQIDFQFAAPHPNKIHFAEIHQYIDTYNRKLECAVGVDNNCKPLLVSLYKYRTLLVLGAIGSGKNMFLSNLVLSLVTSYSTTDLMLAIVDTKSEHLSKFEGEPHLVSSIANNVNDGFILFDKILHELKYRIKLIKESGAETIDDYNRMETTQQPIKPLVIVLNDIQDLANQNKEYLFKFINTLNNHAETLNCCLILVSGSISRDILGVRYDLGFGFRLPPGSDESIGLYANYLSRLYGRGDFVMFDGTNERNVVNRGLSCYMKAAELAKLLDAIKRQGG